MAELSYREIQRGLRQLGVSSQSRVIAHISLPAIGPVHGGAATVVGALTAACRLVVVPTFTPQCQVWPLVGPANNAVDYTDQTDRNADVEMFRPDLPAHADQGEVAEALRLMPAALRSTHPLLSFAAWGDNAKLTLAAQSLAEPLGPIARLANDNGLVVLIGQGQPANVAVHYAEYRAKRKQFVRWALTPKGAVECPAYPGCSAGFDALANPVIAFSRTATIGLAYAQCLPLAPLLSVAEGLLREDPRALLCTRAECAYCNAVRATVP